MQKDRIYKKGLVDYKQERTEQIKNNALVGIRSYENNDRRRRNIMSERLRLHEESERINYEQDKLEVEYIEKYNTYPIYPDHGRAFDAWPTIRMKACMKASKGGTLKVTELNEDDVPEAKRIANALIDEHVKWLRKEFKLD